MKYIATSVKKQGCQVIEVENVEPEDGMLTERRAVLPVADFVGACLWTGAHAAQDDYYYPNYDASANGCVDLMNNVKRVTVTVNGVDYTLNQLDQMRQQGTPLTMQIGVTISFNVLFGS